jgi:hypothetical protein
MLTSLIEQYANIADIASPDINLKVLLRRNVVPAFMADVGYVSWRRVVAALPLLNASGAGYDLPDDFWMMQVLAIAPGFSQPLQYIGDDPEKVMAAEDNTTPGKPGAYYLVRRTTTNVFKKLKFNCVPDVAYTARYTYYSGPVFTDDTTDVEMDKYIPNQFQWALVEGLKKEILWVRFGIGDPRYVQAEQAYGMWIERAKENPELARRTAASFVR